MNVFYKFENKVIQTDYCDQNGFANISAQKIFDNMEFSCIGYESNVRQKKDISDTIFLQKKSIALDEIKIVSRKNQSSTLMGYSKLKREATLSAFKGFEICQFMENTFGKPKAIQSFVFKVIKREKQKTAVRIHLYAKHKDKFEPGEELITEDIIKYFDGKTREMVEIDLTPYNLELPPEGAFIGIEWLGIVDESTGKFVESKNAYTNTRIEINNKILDKYTFISSYKNESAWSNIGNWREGAILKNPMNASFGLKLFND